MGAKLLTARSAKAEATTAMRTAPSGSSTVGLRKFWLRSANPTLTYIGETVKLNWHSLQELSLPIFLLPRKSRARANKIQEL